MKNKERITELESVCAELSNRLEREAANRKACQTRTNKLLNNVERTAEADTKKVDEWLKNAAEEVNSSIQSARRNFEFAKKNLNKSWERKYFEEIDKAISKIDAKVTFADMAIKQYEHIMKEMCAIRKNAAVIQKELEDVRWLVDEDG